VTLMQAVALGVLQGVTEFLPISSSGHLVLAENWLPGIEQPDLLFDVVLHLGTLAAIVWALRGRIEALARGGLGFLPGARRDPSLDTERRWIVLILVACVPTAIVGLALAGAVEGMRSRPPLVGLALITTGLILVGADRIGRRSPERDTLGALDAILVGVVQGLAVIPGISRSGATIAAALWRGARPDAAVDFSLLISIPAVLGAHLLVSLRSAGEIQAADLGPLLVGFAAAFGSGYLSLRALQWVVRQRRLLPFAAYCGLVGVGAAAVG
jgi:undecaprenyl-diphosphatase